MVGHVVLAGQERLFPDHLAVAADARKTLDMTGQRASQQFRADRGRAQLGMRQPEIVLALGDVVGELVAEREADAERRAVLADDIDRCDLRLLAAVLGEGRRGERLFRRDHTGAVALEEPFRLRADFAWLRLAALDAHQKHAHRIGRFFR